MVFEIKLAQLFSQLNFSLRGAVTWFKGSRPKWTFLIWHMVQIDTGILEDQGLHPDYHLLFYLGLGV